MKIPFLTAVLILALTLNPAPAQAAWSTPGQTCDREGDLSNSNGFLTCLSGVWTVNPIIAANLAIGTNTPLVSVDLSNKTDAIALPVGTTGARPTGSYLANGELRYNSTLATVEAYVNGAWVSLLSSSGSGSAIPAVGTEGAVQFNTSNALNADSGFVWDNTNKRLGIGTTIPSTLLDLGAFTGTASTILHIASATGYDSTLKLMETSDNYGFTIKNSNGSIGLTGLNILRHSNSATGTSALYINRDTGQVGIGTTAPGNTLHLYSTGNDAPRMILDYANVTGKHSGVQFNQSGLFKGGVFMAQDTGLMSFWTGGTYRTVIDASGNVGIGTSSPAYLLDVYGNVRLGAGTQSDCPSGWSCKIYTWDISAASLYYTNLAQRSDFRLKHDIADLPDAISNNIQLLRPVSYKWNEGKGPAGEQYGFIAQDVEKIWPELVSTADDKAQTKSVNYMNMIAPMVASIQRLYHLSSDDHDLIVTLKTENDALRSRIEALEAAQRK